MHMNVQAVKNILDKCYCPREGSVMHRKNAQRRSDAFVESFQILLLG